MAKIPTKDEIIEVYKDKIEKHFKRFHNPLIIPYIERTVVTGYSEDVGSPTTHNIIRFVISQEDWFLFNKRAEYNNNFEEILK